MRRILLLLAAILLAAEPAAAQTPPASPSPYAGQEQRAIKALSAEEMRDLSAGRGMGLAKAAELNGYPGPAHVLELAAALQLSAEQEAATRDLHARMQADARQLGAAILAAEEQLERRFAHRHIDGQSLRESLAAIARLQGQLRAVHLEAHLTQTQLLTPAQVARYSVLRGYTGSEAPTEPRPHRH